MDYHQLKAKAKELGLPYHKVPRAELEASINAKLNSAMPPEKVDQYKNSAEESEPKKDNTPNIQPQESATSEQVSSPGPELNKNINTAIILKESNEVRRYTKETHGENFIDLATDYAAKKNLKIKLESLPPAIKCPSCGHRIKF